ncbi:hypothetical protein GCM10023146_25270 [Nocardioides caricicola]
MLAALVAALAVLAPGPAVAHPFGDPQTVEIGGAGGEVRVRWRAGGADDLTLLAVSLGALPASRVMLDGAVWYEDGDAEALAASPAFEDYLLDRIAVTAGTAACPGSLTEIDLLGDGATLTFGCGERADTATVEVRTLLDLHPAYRTLATGPGGQRAVYDRTTASHDWAIAGEPGTPAALPASSEVGRSAAAQLGTVGAVALASVLGGVLWSRRRGRRA